MPGANQRRAAGGRATVRSVNPRATVERYLAALSSANVAATAALVTEDFVNEHTSELGSGVRGRAAYAERLPGFLAQFAALQ